MEFGKNTLDFIRGLIAEIYPTRVIASIVPHQEYTPATIVGDDDVLYFGSCYTDSTLVINYTIIQGNGDPLSIGAYYPGPDPCLFYSVSSTDDILFVGYKITLEAE